MLLPDQGLKLAPCFQWRFFFPLGVRKCCLFFLSRLYFFCCPSGSPSPHFLFSLIINILPCGEKCSDINIFSPFNKLKTLKKNYNRMLIWYILRIIYSRMYWKKGRISPFKILGIKTNSFLRGAVAWNQVCGRIIHMSCATFSQLGASVWRGDLIFGRGICENSPD